MDRKTEYKKFVMLMAATGESTPGGRPSSEQIELYFQCLKDMDYATIKKNVEQHLRINKFFPAISEIRQENLEGQAQEDCMLIENLCKELLFPDFPQAGRTAIQVKLEDMGKDYLMPMVDRWGGEIATGSNPTATRAQMLKSYSAHIERLHLPSGERKKIDRKIEKLTEHIG